MEWHKSQRFVASEYNGRRNAIIFNLIVLSQPPFCAIEFDVGRLSMSRDEYFIIYPSIWRKIELN